VDGDALFKSLAELENRVFVTGVVAWPPNRTRPAT
jgi:hypothetical protein